MAIVISGANRHDMKQLADRLEASVRPCPLAADLADPTIGPPLCLDRGYDYAACRAAASSRGYTPHLPPKATQAQPLPAPGHPDRHPPRRWVVEVGHSWFNRFRRLLIRWEQLGEHYLGFLHLAALLIVYRKLRHARARALPHDTLCLPG